MKKIILVLSLFLFVFASSSFATETSGGGVLICGATDTLTIQLSPKVVASYTGLDDTGAKDFYIISSYHNAGNVIYATASSVAKIYQAKATGTTTLATLYGTVPTTVAGAKSDEAWSNATWSAE